MRQSVIVAAALLRAVAVLALAGPARAQPLSAAAGNCLPEVAAAEARHHLPPGLLLSMALVESGRRDPITGLVAPWPWTLQAQGRGHFYETIEEAAGAARKLLESGDAFVDVGCLQVDLFHHPKAFSTLRAAFEPAANVDYAASYLATLASNHGSWLAAVAAYHAGDPADGVGYMARVLYLWKGIRLSPEALQSAPDNPQRVGFALSPTPQPLDVAEGFFDRKDYPSALALYDEILQHEPDNLTGLLGAGETLLAMGRPDDARAKFEHALLETPKNRLALEGLLRAIDALPSERRFAALVTARGMVPGAPEILSRLAVLDAEQGAMPEAAAIMADAVRQNPEDVLLLLDSALLFDQAGQAGKALAAYETFLSAYRPGYSPALTVSLDSVRRRAAYLYAQAN